MIRRVYLKSGDSVGAEFGALPEVEDFLKTK